MNSVQSHAATRFVKVDPRSIDGFADPHPWRLPLEEWPTGDDAHFQLKSVSPSDSTFMDRSALADALAQTHTRLGQPLLPETVSAIRQDAVFVVAGQQPGLLLGPAYVLYKAATAIQLARRLSREQGRDVLPAFWMASEDHRLEPLLRCMVGGESLVLPSPSTPVPASAHALGPHGQAIEDFLNGALDEPSRQRLKQHLDFDDGATLADYFAKGLLSVFARHGLVMIDPEALRPLAQPVLQKAVIHWTDLESALETGAESVRRSGFEPPIPKLSLFEINGGVRRALNLAEAKASSALSPGVALRPLVQDALLPVVATVAGPTETTYLWQVDPLYAAMGVRRSAVVPRLSATVVDAQTVQEASSLGLDGAAIFLSKQKLRDGGAGGEGEDEDASLVRAADQLVEQIESHRTDSNRKIMDKAVQSIRHQVKKVMDRMAREAGGDAKLSQLVSKIYPSKRPQERQPGGAAEIIARVGVDWLEGLIEQTDALEPVHWLLVLDSAAGGEA